MSSTKKKSNTSASKRRQAAARKKERQNVAKHSTILFWFTAIALIAIFLGRWYTAIGSGYFSSFVEIDAATATAVSNMKGLVPTDEEKALLLPVQREWDLWSSSRLRDEVETTAADGAELHGYLYNEGADVTVIVLPRFYQDGTADFLPGPYLHELTGCNLLLPDPREHGGSRGGYFTYGVREQNDIAAWIAWADAALGPQTYILWGEGTGANTILLAAANDLLPASVAFAVAESPYASLEELAQDRIWSWYSVPMPFLSAVEGKLHRSAAGFTLQDAGVEAALEDKTPKTPVIFLCSAGDKYIDTEWTEAVIAAYAGPSETVTGGGSHGTVYAAQQTEIDALLARWWAAVEAYRTAS